jgi:hypothetical protein
MEQGEIINVQQRLLQEKDEEIRSLSELVGAHKEQVSVLHDYMDSDEIARLFRGTHDSGLQDIRGQRTPISVLIGHDRRNDSHYIPSFLNPKPDIRPFRPPPTISLPPPVYHEVAPIMRPPPPVMPSPVYHQPVPAPTIAARPRPASPRQAVYKEDDAEEF